MIQGIRLNQLLFRSLLLAFALFFSFGTAITHSAWESITPTPISSIDGGCCDGQTVIVEGQVTNLMSGVPEAWKVYDFTDGTNTTAVNFEDILPDTAIIRNTTVRILGTVNQGDWFTDIKVAGVQIQGVLPFQATATAAGVNSGSLDNQYVVLEGNVINERDPSFPTEWNVYKFTDTSGTTALDFENELRLQPNHFPNETILVSGIVDDYNPRKIDDPTMFVGTGTPVDQFNLTVSKGGDGFGNVTSSPSGINCGSTCKAAFDDGTSVTLTATADFGSEFSSWSGCNQTLGNNCTVTMTAAKTVTVTFAEGGGPGGDWVWQPVTPISQIEGGCCDEQVVVVEGQVTDPTSGWPEEWLIYDFTDGSNTTSVNFEDNLPESAIIRNTTVRILGIVNQGDLLTDINVAGIQTMGNLPLKATATAAGVNSGSFDDQYVVLEGRVTGELDPNFPAQWSVYKFTDTSGTTSIDFENELQSNQFPTETILISGTVDNSNPRKVNDPTMFVGAGTPAQQSMLSVDMAGDGSGTVISVPPGINCGSSCTASFDNGTSVILTATPDPGSRFSGWNDCNQTQGNKCTVQITQRKLVTARFNESIVLIAPHTLLIFED